MSEEKIVLCSNCGFEIPDFIPVCPRCEKKRITPKAMEFRNFIKLGERRVRLLKNLDKLPEPPRRIPKS